MGGIGLIFTPVLVRHLLGPLGLFSPMTSTSWTHSYLETGNWNSRKTGTGTCKNCCCSSDPLPVMFTYLALH